MSWSLAAEEEGREEEGGEGGERGEGREEERGEGGGGRGEGRRKEGWKFKRWSRHSLFPGLPTCIQDGVTFSFLSLAVVFLSGYVHSSSLSSDTSWSLSRGVLFLGYQRYTEVYPRTGFNCENLIIANAGFSRVRKLLIHKFFY